MKKHLSILMVVLMVISAFSLPMNVEAVEYTLPVDTSFVDSSQLSVTPCNDGFTEITLTGIEELAIPSTRSSIDPSYKATSLTFLAETEEEKSNILSRIGEIKSSGGTVYDDDWFFGSSCYIYISVTYTTRSASNGTEARVNSVTTQHSVKSGTSVSNAVLHLACIGTSSDSGVTNLEEDVTVTTTPYTNTLMNSWPYIHTGGPCLGANYTVTATRSSGSSSTHTVSATVFAN